ncbi:MAG: ComF family protein [Candidatus Omnitrophica bacterium]|nr:ComF family protein [Candidatus Omnitrophota bacterium]
MLSLIHLFKYKNYDYLAGFLSSLIIKHLSEIGFNPNKYKLITSVPLHKDKLKIRGYNQSGLLSKLLSNHFKIPFKDDIIENTNIRPSQTKLPREKREKNTEGIFVVKENLENKSIILVDDIFTTGSTVSACAKALKEKCAGNVTVITLSKT